MFLEFAKHLNCLFRLKIVNVRANFSNSKVESSAFTNEIQQNDSLASWLLYKYVWQERVTRFVKCQSTNLLFSSRGRKLTLSSNLSVDNRLNPAQICYIFISVRLVVCLRDLDTGVLNSELTPSLEPWIL